MFKERLNFSLKCNLHLGLKLVDLGCFVVDLRESRLDYWAPYSDTHSREGSSIHERRTANA